jgi:hypothetical protein
MFRRCPRQWYYKNVVASAIAKDEHRRRIYVLSKLQSVSAWRGQIVDRVISVVIMDRLRRRQKITLDEAKRLAHEQFRRELAFARNHSDLSGVSPSSDDFVALHELYYNGSIAEADLNVALSEIDCALLNLFKMEGIKSALKEASTLIAQRTLVFQQCETSVRAVPDIIAFFDNRAPLIVDWKVHSFGIQEAWLQLAVYAMALTRCKPHKDFPSDLKSFGPTDIELIEAQLLTGNIRRYHLDHEEIERAELYIAESVDEIDLAIADREYSELKDEDFGVTSYAATCKGCAFREVCWSVR